MDYIILILISIILGQVTKHLCFKFPPVVAEEITYGQFLKTFKSGFKIDIKYSLILSAFSVAMIYLTSNSLLNVFLYLLVIFSLLIVFSVDYRFQLIPDECSLFIGYVALIYIIVNKSSMLNCVLAALAGGGIFFLLGQLAIIIFKKEGMGFGDVKLMFVLGLLFGLKNILVITLVSFFIAAIVSVIVMIVKRQGLDEYIPFGPFIVIGAILLMFFKAEVFMDLYFNMCMGLSNLFVDFVYSLIIKE